MDAAAARQTAAASAACSLQHSSADAEWNGAGDADVALQAVDAVRSRPPGAARAAHCRVHDHDAREPAPAWPCLLPDVERPRQRAADSPPPAQRGANDDDVVGALVPTTVLRIVAGSTAAGQEQAPPSEHDGPDGDAHAARNDVVDVPALGRICHDSAPGANA